MIQQHDLFELKGAERQFLPPSQGGVGVVTNRIFTFKPVIFQRAALEALCTLGLQVPVTPLARSSSFQLVSASEFWNLGL
jgi:hypothetical protein